VAAGDHLRAGLRLSYASIAWTAVASSASVGFGIAAGSLVLVAFGLTGLLDGAGSVALVAHFRHTLRHEAHSEARERLAHRVVSIGLVVTATATGIESLRRLITGAEARGSVPGAVLAAASVVVLGVLARAKRRVAAQVDSQALLADSYLSAAGASLGVVTVIGAVVSSAAWVDPACALVIAAGAGFLGQRELRASRGQ
jgi:divalent metal cation (Fe/Co/Zn/Cd) transporter